MLALRVFPPEPQATTKTVTSSAPIHRRALSNTVVIGLILILFLAMSVFSTLSLLHQDRLNQTEQMLTTAQILERVLVLHATPPVEPFRLQTELDNVSMRDKRYVRLTLYVNHDGTYSAAAGTWPSLLGHSPSARQLAVMEGGEAVLDDETVAGHNAVRLTYPLRNVDGDPVAILDMLMIAERPATLAAGLYAGAATLVIAMLVAYFTRHQRLLGGELARRRTAEQELKRHRDSLEDTVRERTSDLIRANRLLEREISERELMAERIKSSLAEKEMLLQEIHHRVKNNLQIVASLLDMAGRRAANAEVLDICTELSSKVHGISLVHTQLYQNETIDQIDMGKYTRELNSYLVRVYNAADIDAHIEDDGVLLPIVAATPLGMVINELLTNAYKHAFGTVEGGKAVFVSMRHTGRTIVVTVRDTGPGIPDGLDPARSDSMGLKLVNNIVTYQLMGTVRYTPGPGAETVIEFDRDHFPEQPGEGGGPATAS